MARFNIAKWSREHRKSAKRRRKSHKRKHHRARHSSSRALVRHVHHHPARRGRRRGGGGGVGGFGELVSARTLIPVAALAAAWGYAGENVSEFADVLRKVPGVKTFGAPLVIGGIALGVNRYIYANKWLRLIAAVGIAYGAWTWGKTKFAIPSWVGDATGDVADVT